MEEWNVEALAEIPLRREWKNGMMEKWKNGKMEFWTGKLPTADFHLTCHEFGDN